MMLVRCSDDVAYACEWCWVKNSNELLFVSCIIGFEMTLLMCVESVEMIHLRCVSDVEITLVRCVDNVDMMHLRCINSV